MTCGSEAEGSPDHVMELESILTAISHLPPLEETDAAGFGSANGKVTS